MGKALCQSYMAVPCRASLHLNSCLTEGQHAPYFDDGHQRKATSFFEVSPSALHDVPCSLEPAHKRVLLRPQNLLHPTILVGYDVRHVDSLCQRKDSSDGHIYVVAPELTTRPTCKHWCH